MKSKLIIPLMILFFVGLGGFMFRRYRVNVAYRETATKTLFRPYFDAVLHGKLTDAYDNFTDDYYKSEFALDDYLAAHAKTLRENGKFIGYEINTFRDCGGIFAARALLCTSVILKFERGDTKLLQYQLQQGADNQFRIKFSGQENSRRIYRFPF